VNNMFDKRINIFTGHFGSGKSEIAVNYAFKLNQMNYRTAIADLDVVNPFFRTTDVKSELEANGIHVVTTLYANTNVDVPALSPEINKLFENKDFKVVLDVGGDDLGAKVLGRYKEQIVNDSYRMYCVINTKRPMTDTKEKIISMIRDIEESSGIKVDMLINNTNLLQNTTPDDIMEGHELIKQVSEELSIPIAFACGFSSTLNSIREKLQGKVFYLNKYIKLPWDN